MDFFVKKKDFSCCEKNLFFDKGSKSLTPARTVSWLPDPSVTDQHLL
jgi:hypothetical protein